MLLGTGQRRWQVLIKVTRSQVQKLQQALQLESRDSINLEPLKELAEISPDTEKEEWCVLSREFNFGDDMFADDRAM